MKRRVVWVIAACAAAVVTGVGASRIVDAPAPSSRELAQLEGDVNRGAYVARLSGCIGCHTDAKSGGAVLGGGAAIKTPFGTFFAPNITPHDVDGIGQWSLEDFATSLTAGVSPSGQHYFPAFPYPFYTHLSDQDLVDLWAAVRSVPPAAGKPPPHDLPFPYNLREAVGIWKLLNFRPPDVVGEPAAAGPTDRGRYIVDGPAHCGSCHTPRDILGGRDLGLKFQGGESAGGEKAPAITAVALSAAGWTADDLAYALGTGIKPDGDVFGGSMAEVIRDGSQFWSDSDRGAVANYLLEGSDK